jgi:hypothetical protein
LAKVKQKGELKLQHSEPLALEGFSNPRFTKRAAPWAHGAAALRTIGSLILRPCSSALQGPCSIGPPDLPETPTPQAAGSALGPHPSNWPGRQSTDPHILHLQYPSGMRSQYYTGPHDLHSAGPMPLRPCQASHPQPCTISAGQAPQACHASNTEACTFSVGLCP